MFEVLTSLSALGLEGIPQQSAQVELNLGFHGVSIQGKETVAIDRSIVEQRFNSLRKRMESHLNNGNKVVYIMEVSNYTYDFAEKIDAFCEQGMLPSKADLAAWGFTDCDPLSEDFDYERFYSSPFRISEMRMVDDLTRLYPDQFIFRYERGSEDRVNKGKLSIEYINRAVQCIREDDWDAAHIWFEKERPLSEETFNKRNVDAARLIADTINRYKGLNLFIVASFGKEHGSGISHELQMRGILSTSVITDHPPVKSVTF